MYILSKVLATGHPCLHVCMYITDQMQLADTHKHTVKIHTELPIMFTLYYTVWEVKHGKPVKQISWRIKAHAIQAVLEMMKQTTSQAAIEAFKVVVLAIKRKGKPSMPSKMIHQRPPDKEWDPPCDNLFSTGIQMTNAWNLKTLKWR